MFSAANIFFVCVVALLAVILGLSIALVSWHLAVFIRNEFIEFVDVYKGERRKCLEEDDFLFTQWVKRFHNEPLNKLREYSDVY